MQSPHSAGEGMQHGKISYHDKIHDPPEQIYLA